MDLYKVKRRIEELSDKEKARNSMRFFKTGKGEYGEGDVFVGIKMPVLRKMATEFKELSPDDVIELLHSKIHEERMLALLILMKKFNKANENEKENIYRIYIKNRKYINSWDLIDVTCPHIMGKFLLNREKTILYDLAKSPNLWDRRIAIIATFEFIRNNQFEDTLRISEILLNDNHDLIHKAVGWMLREIGKRNIDIEKDFLKTRYKKMPRTMLRYAIEKFEETERQKYLKGLV